jgi:hypothetical protein
VIFSHIYVIFSHISVIFSHIYVIFTHMTKDYVHVQDHHDPLEALSRAEGALQASIWDRVACIDKFEFTSRIYI